MPPELQAKLDAVNQARVAAEAATQSVVDKATEFVKGMIDYYGLAFVPAPQRVDPPK